MKYCYFSLPETISNNTSDDPSVILDKALYLRDKKNKTKALINNVKQRLGIYKEPSTGDKLMENIHDLGAGGGLGVTMLGGKLKQYELTKPLGKKLKTHGINTLLDKDLQLAYGLGIPAVGISAGLGIGAANLVRNNTEDE